MNTLFKALSHPVRRRIIEMLRKGPLASGDIASAFDMSWPSITGHLNALKAAGLVSPERDGATIRYRLEISVVEEAVAFLLDMTGTAPSAPDDTEPT
ncbi:metalloregulator ArsR/SmtB family transcription factor [uncultured Brevundimonas sp.]|uniref:metalloregulator ArsR/SmtB family transcription factor n=1 Tax=uncultured Brevundimonas sp. TaxID=213418 RepID=UPI0030ED2D31|tara:strand:+ start:4361 stop:4651 length:291 start_codon:yes stop_codon:yes gene_type:complete